MKTNEFLRLWRKFQRVNPEKAREMEQEATILVDIERGLRCPQCREKRPLEKAGDICENCLEQGEE